MRKWKWITGALLLIGVLLVAGTFYQKTAREAELQTYQPVGKFAEVNQKKMHYYEGGKGDVTVVFASGWGTVNPYADFYPLYEQVGRTAQFVVYDRPGYGYSDLTDKERDIDTMVEEMHTLLQQSGHKPPYVLVGHSLASLETIRYAQTYADEVKGIVLIDSGSPELYAAQEPVTFIPSVHKFLVNTGIARLLYQSDSIADALNDQRNGLQLLPAELKELDKTATLIKSNNENIISEMEQSSKNASAVLAGSKPLQIPITVLTAGDKGGENDTWMEAQKQLLAWSAKGKQVIVPDAAHYIHHYHPELITEEIAHLIR